MSRFDRFNHLERDRRPGEEDDEAKKQQRQQRFDSLEQAPVEPPPPEYDVMARPRPEAATGASMERFAADGDSAVVLDREDDGAGFGTRCCVCERECGRFDSVCKQCGNSLNSAQQQAYTAQLRAQRREAQDTLKEQQELIARRNDQEAERQRRMAQMGVDMFDPKRVQLLRRDATRAPADDLLDQLPPYYRGRFRSSAVIVALGAMVGSVVRAGEIGPRALIFLVAAGALWVLVPRFWRDMGE